MYFNVEIKANKSWSVSRSVWIYCASVAKNLEKWIVHQIILLTHLEIVNILDPYTEQMKLQVP